MNPNLFSDPSTATNLNYLINKSLREVKELTKLRDSIKPGGTTLKKIEKIFNKYGYTITRFGKVTIDLDFFDRCNPFLIFGVNVSAKRTSPKATKKYKDVSFEGFDGHEEGDFTIFQLEDSKKYKVEWTFDI